MREFSFGNAWTFGLRFFAGRAASHAIILLGMGILLPFALQYLLGQASGIMSSSSTNGVDPAPAAGATGVALVVMIVGCVLQFGSLFASWRLGFDPGTKPAGALMFGLIGGLATVVAFGLVVGLFGFSFAQLAPTVGILAAAIASFLVLCLVFTTIAALLAVGIFLFLGIAMLVGAATGDVGLAATLVGGSGFLVVILLILSGLFLWLAGRLSCTVALMIEGRRFNLFAAAAESWRLTWDDEWRIMRYLGVVGLIAAVLIIGGAIGVSAGAAAIYPNYPDSANPAAGIAVAIYLLAMMLPLIYLTVLVPAGIYRELAGTSFSAEVFA